MLGSSTALGAAWRLHTLGKSLNHAQIRLYESTEQAREEKRTLAYLCQRLVPTAQPEEGRQILAWQGRSPCQHKVG